MKERLWNCHVAKQLCPWVSLLDNFLSLKSPQLVPVGPQDHQEPSSPASGPFLKLLTAECWVIPVKELAAN